MAHVAVEHFASEPDFHNSKDTGSSVVVAVLDENMVVLALN